MGKMNCKVFISEEGLTEIPPFHVRLLEKFREIYGEETLGDAIAYILDDYFFNQQPAIWNKIYHQHFEVEGNEE